MDGWGYVTNSRGYDATLISYHWIFRHVPFWGEGENAQNHAEKCGHALI